MIHCFLLTFCSYEKKCYQLISKFVGFALLFVIRNCWKNSRLIIRRLWRLQVPQVKDTTITKLTLHCQRWCCQGWIPDEFLWKGFVIFECCNKVRYFWKWKKVKKKNNLMSKIPESDVTVKTSHKIYHQNTGLKASNSIFFFGSIKNSVLFKNCINFLRSAKWEKTSTMK